MWQPGAGPAELRLGQRGVLNAAGTRVEPDPQLAAFFTRAAILASSAVVSFVNA